MEESKVPNEQQLRRPLLSGPKPQGEGLLECCTPGASLAGAQSWPSLLPSLLLPITDRNNTLQSITLFTFNLFAINRLSHLILKTNPKGLVTSI